MAWVCLLVNELLIELGSKLLNVIILLYVVVSSIVYELIAVFIITLVLILLLDVHSRASPAKCCLVLVP